MRVGAYDGITVSIIYGGDEVGIDDGATDGVDDGATDGNADDCPLGSALGSIDGIHVGAHDGIHEANAYSEYRKLAFRSTYRSNSQ